MAVQLIDTPPVAGSAAHLRFARCGSATILERSFATNPLKLLTTRGVGDTCWVYNVTYGGGIVGGDAIELNVEAARGTRGVLTTQASTKVYRSLHPATQQVTAAIDDEALLAVLPDPVVCFAGADFSQRQNYELTGRANLVVIDWISSGRHAAGERWAFRRYSNRIDIRREGRRVLYDAVLLDHADGPIAERLGAFEVCLTAIVTGPLLLHESARIVDVFSSRGIRAGRTPVCSAWTLPDGGALLRIAGISVEQVGAVLREQFSFLTRLLADDPWGGKW